MGRSLGKFSRLISRVTLAAGVRRCRQIRGPIQWRLSAAYAARHEAACHRESGYGTESRLFGNTVP
ncbi:hypothetical protein BconGalA64_39750 [Burkholderia contaminans]|nr:hypothetical protein BconGalA64_39750 [Burkholderia contaminans]